MQGLLHLSSQGMRAYSWRKGALTFDGAFAETTSGIESFRTHLNERRSIPFRLLIDLPDEGFRLETIPPARGADRHAIIRRRTAQMENATPYIATVSLGKQNSGRGNETLMLATFTRPAHISPWLDACNDVGALLQQITSPPFLLSQLLKSLGLHQGRHLLFTLGSGGLRQTYFDAGQLQFSRLTATCLSPGDAAVICFNEAHKLRHYLGGGLRPAAEAQFHALLPHQDIPAFEAHRMADSEVLIHVIDLSRVETELCLPPCQPDDFERDARLLHAMAKGESTAQFAPVQILKPYRLWQWRRWLRLFSWAAFGSGLLSATAYGLLAWSATVETQAQELRNQASRLQYQALLQTLPPMPAAASEVRSLSASMRALHAATRFPEATYRQLSYALDQTPEVELDRIEWRLITSADRGQPDQDEHENHRPARRALTTAIANIDLHTTGGTDAVAVEEGLAAKLRSAPKIKVEVIPQSALNGENPTASAQDRFSLRLTHEGP